MDAIVAADSDDNDEPSVIRRRPRRWFPVLDVDDDGGPMSEADGAAARAALARLSERGREPGTPFAFVGEMNRAAERSFVPKPSDDGTPPTRRAANLFVGATLLALHIVTSRDPDVRSADPFTDDDAAFCEAVVWLATGRADFVTTPATLASDLGAEFSRWGVQHAHRLITIMEHLDPSRPVAEALTVDFNDDGHVVLELPSSPSEEVTQAA
jgi:hypothetical protein